MFNFGGFFFIDELNDYIYYYEIIALEQFSYIHAKNALTKQLKQIAKLMMCAYSNESKRSEIGKIRMFVRSKKMMSDPISKTEFNLNVKSRKILMESIFKMLKTDIIQHIETAPFI